MDINEKFPDKSLSRCMRRAVTWHDSSKGGHKAVIPVVLVVEFWWELFGWFWELFDRLDEAVSQNCCHERKWLEIQWILMRFLPKIIKFLACLTSVVCQSREISKNFPRVLMKFNKFIIFLKDFIIKLLETKFRNLWAKQVLTKILYSNKSCSKNDTKLIKIDRETFINDFTSYRCAQPPLVSDSSHQMMTSPGQTTLVLL